MKSETHRVCDPQQPSAQPGTNSAPISRIIGLGAFAAIWIWAIGGKVDLRAFLDRGSLLIVVGCSFALLLAACGWTGLRSAVTTLIGQRASARATLDGLNVFRLAAAFAVACGLVATLVGLIVSLHHMSDPSMIGPAVASAMLPLLYGAVVALLCLVAATVLARRETSGEAANEFDRLGRQTVRVAGVTAGVGVSAVLLVLFASLLSMSEIKRDPRFDATITDLRMRFGEDPAGNASSEDMEHGSPHSLPAEHSK